MELKGQTRFISALEGGEIDKSTGELLNKGLIIEVPRFARHNWGRLEHYNELHRPLARGVSSQLALPEDWDEEAVVEEWTDPIDAGKPLFFWNLNGIITAPSCIVLRTRQRIARYLLGGRWIDIQLFVVFWELDNWPIFFDLRKQLRLEGSQRALIGITDGVEMVVSFIIVFIARLFGLFLGLHAVGQQRTPDALWNAYRKTSRDL